MRIYLVYEQIGQAQISYGVIVLSSVIIIGIGTECLSQTVVIVKHGGYAVEPEAVEFKFFQPVFTIG